MKQVLLHVVGALGGAAAAFVHLPLPWIVGSMLAGSAMALLWRCSPAPRASRILGQIVIGSALGLAVTSDALTAIAMDLHLVTAAALFTVAISVLLALAQVRFARTDLPTAMFSSIPGGPAEMAQFAERYGGDPSRVALSQTLRIMALVTCFPALMALIGEADFRLLAAVNRTANAWGLLALFGSAAVGAALASLCRVASPAFLGALLMVGALTATGILYSSMPESLAILGQILVGISIGSRFTRSLFRSGWRLLVQVTATTAALLAGCIMAAAAAAWFMEADFRTMILANAPGSMPEMAMTARALDLDFSAVIAFHVARLLIVMISMPLIYAGAVAWLGPGRSK